MTRGMISTLLMAALLGAACSASNIGPARALPVAPAGSMFDSPGAEIGAGTAAFHSIPPPFSWDAGDFNVRPPVDDNEDAWNGVVTDANNSRIRHADALGEELLLNSSFASGSSTAIVGYIDSLTSAGPDNLSFGASEHENAESLANWEIFYYSIPVGLLLICAVAWGLVSHLRKGLFEPVYSRGGRSRSFRYGLRIGDRGFTNLARHELFFHTLKALTDKGIGVDAVLKHLPERKFLGIPGRLSVEEFRREAVLLRNSGAAAHDLKRLFLQEGELIYSDGKTWAVSNRWSRNNLPALDALIAHHQQADISYVKIGAAADSPPDVQRPASKRRRRRRTHATRRDAQDKNETDSVKLG